MDPDQSGNYIYAKKNLEGLWVRYISARVICPFVVPTATTSNSVWI
jgi:hypothetical protein